MDKKVKNNISVVSFIIGFILILMQDLSRLQTIDFPFTWPWAVMFYVGLLLILVGFLLRG